MRARLAWLGNRPWLVALVVFVAVVVPGFVRVEQLAGAREQDRVNSEQQRDKLITCLTEWADKVTDRSNAILIPSQARNEANDVVLRAAAASDIAALRAGLHAYVDASDALKKAAEEHPVPPSPRLTC